MMVARTESRRVDVPGLRAKAREKAGRTQDQVDVRYREMIWEEGGWEDKPKERE